MIVGRDNAARRTAIVCCTLIAACNPGAGKIAYVGGTVWDGTGAPSVADAIILVNGDSIEAMGSAETVDVPRGAEVRRIDGTWVIPGLIDAHAHTERWMLRSLLRHGITAVRDGGGDADSLVALRNDLGLGAEIGPRLFVAGSAIDGVPPETPTATGVRTPIQARRAVDQVKLAEGSHVMISTKVNRPILQALLDEASLLNLPVGGHLGRVDAVTAAREGVAAIEHLSGVVEATVSNPSSYFRAHGDYYSGWSQFLGGWNRVDSAALDRTARQLAATEVMLVPTLINQISFANLQNPSFLDSVDLSGVPEEIVARWAIPSVVRDAGLTSTDFATFRLGLENQSLFVRRFMAAGGTVAAGSNTPRLLLAPGLSLHHELQALVEAGLTPEQSLLAATRDAALLLRVDSIGFIGPGAAADFVVLNGNPLIDIANLGAIHLVVVRGIQHAPTDLQP